MKMSPGSRETESVLSFHRKLSCATQFDGDVSMCEISQSGQLQKPMFIIAYIIIANA